MMVILSTIALSFVNSTNPSEMKVFPNHLFAFTHHPVLNGGEMALYEQALQKLRLTSFHVIIINFRASIIYLAVWLCMLCLNLVCRSYLALFG